MSTADQEPQDASGDDEQLALTLIDPAEVPEEELIAPAEDLGDEAAAETPTESPEDLGAEEPSDPPAEEPDNPPNETIGGSSSGSSGGIGADDSDESDESDTPEGTPSKAEVLAALQALPPLPKPHYYAPSVMAYNPDWLDYNREIVRITRTSGIAGAYAEYRTRFAVQVAVEANEAEPDAIPTGLHMYWAPWLIEYKSAPHPPTDFGDLYVQGLERMRTTLANQRAWIDTANTMFNSDIDVTQCFLEIEFWPIPLDDDPEWRAALLRRQDECYDLIKSYYPNATITWFNRGAIYDRGRGNGLVFYSGTRQFTELEKGDTCSTTLYRLGGGMQTTLEAMRRTVENVDAKYGEDVPIIPYIAIGAGYRFTMDNPYMSHFHRVWDYDVVRSYKMGMFVNRPIYGDNGGNVLLGADWSRVPAVILYPELLDHKRSELTQVQTRLKHFIAYCCGATDSPFPTNLWPYE